MTVVDEAGETVVEDTDSPPRPTGEPRRRAGWNLRRLGLRLVGTVAALWVLVTLTFLGLHVMGNPVLQMVGETATDEQIETLSRAHGYDRPLLVQYTDFLTSVASGNFGSSLRYGRPALEVVVERLPATFLLAGAGMAGGVALGAAAGWLAVFGRRERGAGIPLAVLTGLQSFPAFFKGIVLMLIFAVLLGWLPTGGFTGWAGLVLPATTLALATAPAVGRVWRASLVGAERAPHVRTAIAKGLSPRRIRHSHIERNALGPVTTLVGLQLATLLGGALIVEQVFGWPGIGQLLFHAIESQDHPVVLAGTFVIGVVFVVVTLLTDELGRVIDPRTGAQ